VEEARETERCEGSWLERKRERIIGKEEKRSLVGRLGQCSREREVGKIRQATVGDRAAIS
jgi:hypothetical protein